MKRIHAIALGTALFGLSCGVAWAQTVSGGNPYEQGYAAGVAAKQQNSFEAFDNGYQAGKVQSDAQTRTTSTDAYAQGYQAGLARANRDREQAFNEGYETRGEQDRRVAARAYDNGFDAGAYLRSRDDLEFP